MKKICVFIICSLFVGLLAGCGLSQELEDAGAVGQDYYKSLQAEDYNEAVSFYSTEFFEATPRADTLQLLQGIGSQLGKMLYYKLDYSEKNSFVGTGGKRTIYILYYDVTYSKGSSKETLTMTRSEDGEFEILGFDIDSADLLR